MILHEAGFWGMTTDAAELHPVRFPHSVLLYQHGLSCNVMCGLYGEVLNSRSKNAVCL